MSRDTATNAPCSRLTRVLSGSMLFHLGNKCLQCLHQYWQCVLCSILLKKHFMGIKTNSFQKGNKDLLPQISHDVQSSNTQSDEDGTLIYGSCFNNIRNIRIVIDEISKWTTIDYPASVVMAIHCFKCVNIITKKLSNPVPE